MTRGLSWALAALAGAALTANTKGMTRGPVGDEQAEGQPVKALIIGIGEFAELGEDANLPFAEKDAEGLADTLREVVALDELQVMTGHEATHEVVTSAVDNLLGSAKEDDIVLIHIVTHGARIARQGFLMTHDTQPEGQLALTSVKLSSLKKAVTNSRAAQVILTVDASHQALKGIPETVRTGPSHSVSPLIGAIGLEQDQVFVMTANQGHAGSAYGDEYCGGHGLFTCALMQAWQGDADADLDGIVDLGEIARTVPTIVGDQAEGQVPGAYGRYNDDLGVQTFAAPIAPWKPLEAVDICFGSEGFPVGASHPFKTGQTFEMAFTVPESGYMYLDNYGPDGEHNVLYPWLGETNRVSAGSTITLPPPDGEPITFTAPGGVETLILRWSATPLETAPLATTKTKGMRRGATAVSPHCSRYTPTAGPRDTWTIQIALDHK
jgi:hypothetical protein